MKKYILLPKDLRFCKICHNTIFRYNRSRLCISCKNIEHNKKNIGKFGDKAMAFKGNDAGHSTIHWWINRHYGKANKCENSNCKKISKYFEWANINNHIYTRERKHYIMLCRQCHSLMDKRRVLCP